MNASMVPARGFRSRAAAPACGSRPAPADVLRDELGGFTSADRVSMPARGRGRAFGPHTMAESSAPTLSLFTQTFKTAYGMPPRDDRQQMRTGLRTD